jgi:phage shock protein PspC (stress-responsive transcriptional regulator)
MNKTIIININGIVFHIEEDAYESLKKYMYDVKNHFGTGPDSEEIVQDIESRIAEMFSESLLASKKEVITLTEVQTIISQMGSPHDFEESDGQAESTYTAPPFESFTTTRKLMRDTQQQYIAGVCSGIALYLNIDVRIIRVLFLLMAFMGGFGIFLYVLLWILLSPAQTRFERMEMRGEMFNLHNIKRRFDTEMVEMNRQMHKGSNQMKIGVQRFLSFCKRILKFAFKTIALASLIFLVGGGIFLVAVFIAGFDAFGESNNPNIFDIQLVDRSIRSELMITGLLTLLIPIIGLICLIIYIAFNKTLITKFTGLGMLLIWIATLGFLGYYVTYTFIDFNEKSTLVQEKSFSKAPLYKLTLRDLNIILLDSTTDFEHRASYIRNQSQSQKMHLPEEKQRVHIYFQPIDSLLIPFALAEYQAKGKNFDVASERAGRMQYNFEQLNDQIQFDSHFVLPANSVYRHQSVTITLKIPVGTVIWIHQDLRRYIYQLNTSECYNNTLVANGSVGDYTEWMMTKTGLKCLAPTPPVEEEEMLVDSLRISVE